GAAVQAAGDTPDRRAALPRRGRARVARPYRRIRRVDGALGRRRPAGALPQGTTGYPPVLTASLGGLVTDSALASSWRSSVRYLHSILRIVAAFYLLQFGTAKLFPFPCAIMPGRGTHPV